MLRSSELAKVPLEELGSMSKARVLVSMVMEMELSAKVGVVLFSPNNRATKTTASFKKHLICSENNTLPYDLI